MYMGIKTHRRKILTIKKRILFHPGPQIQSKNLHYGKRILCMNH